MIKDQVRIANGKVYGLDLGSITIFLRNIGYEETELEEIIRGLKIIFREIYNGKEN